MKSKIFLLTITLLGFGIANAGDSGIDPVNGKKEDLVGSVQQSENKKPLTKVNITAYLLSQKMKSVQTDDNGNYSFDDLKPGVYKFTFEKAGFKKVVRDKVVVKSDEAFQINIEMEETRQFDLGPNALHFSDF